MESAQQYVEAVAVRYEAKTNTILLGKGVPTSLAHVSRTLNRPDLLQEVAPGEWMLSANLQIEPGARLRIAAPEVLWLKLRSDAQDFVWIKALGGQLQFINTCVTSWDSTRNTIDEDYADGRSFVLARDGARMSIRNSVFSYLGYGANESYGVAWRLSDTSGEVIDSQFAYNFYGLYTYEVSNLAIIGNKVHHSVRYGIDPHTRSHRLRIENNIAYNNGKHGIILAEECRESVIRNNTVYNNAMHGIVLYQHSDHNLVENNTAYANGLQGININNSAHNTLRHNLSYDNVTDGIGVGQDAADNLIANNTVQNNHKDGIYLFNDATGNVLSNNMVSGNARYGIYIKSENNRIAEGNQVFDNRIGVYLNFDNPPDVPQQTNQIYGNRQVNVRIQDN